MNSLALELNRQLSGTVVYELLSDFGKRMYFPKGIVAQTAEAGRKAKRYNATVGMAFHDSEPLILPSLKKLLPSLSPTEAVAYAPTAGIKELRECWKDEIIRKNPSLKPDAFSIPLVSSGLTNGLFLLSDLFVDTEDIIILPDLYWGNYRLIMQERRKARILTFPFFNEDLRFNIKGFSEAINEAAKTGKVVTILNFPNNPTGYSPSREEAENIAAVLKSAAEKGAKMLVVTDDAYFGLFYEKESCKESLFSSLSELHRNILAVKVDGVTKEDFAWGFRLGFLSFANIDMDQSQYSALENKVMGAVRSSISNSSRIAQSLILKLIKSQDYAKEKERNYRELESRFHMVKKILAEADVPQTLRALPFNSGYFMSFSCQGISAEDLRKKLLEKGIGTISIGEDYLRIAYSNIEASAIEELYREIFSTASEL